MRMLVLGSYYSNNLGDGVICECTAALLRKNFPEAEIIICDLMDRDHFQKNLSETYESAKRNRWHVLLRRFVSRNHLKDKQFSSSMYLVDLSRPQIERVLAMDCDAVVFAGGQMYMDSYAMLLEAYIRGFDRRGIPMYFNACGTGPSVSAEIQNRMREAFSLKSVKWISCRDDIRTLQETYLADQVSAVNTFDPALWAGAVYDVTPEPASDVIGLGMMFADTIAPNQMLHFWMQIIRLLEEKQIPWKILINGGATDYAFVQELYRRLPEPKRPIGELLVPVPEKPEDLVRQIAGFRGILSMRLHSHIIAASMGIPSVAVTWDDKLAFFFEKLGYAERCCRITEKPVAVLQKLQAAVEQGVNPDVIRAQKETAEELLAEQIRSIYRL